MILSFKNKIGKLSKPSIRQPKEQIPREFVHFHSQPLLTSFISKIGKYGIGVRTCYHVRRFTLRHTELHIAHG